MNAFGKIILLTCSFLIGYNTSGNASTIIGATIHSTNMGNLYDSLAIEHIVNKSGLTVPYISGFDDFDAYLASPNSAHSFAGEHEWFSNRAQSGFIIFDLGQKYFIDRVAIWNEDSQGIKNFSISASPDNIAYGGAVNHLATNTLHDSPYNAAAYALASTSLARYIKIEVIDVFPHNTGSDLLATLGEVAFSAVPEPTTLLLFSTGILGLAGIRRRKK